MNKEAGELLVAARKRIGWTQEEAAAQLAETLGQTYSQRQYQKLEDGNFPKFKRSIVAALDKLMGTNLIEQVYEHNVPRESNEANEPAIPYREQRRKQKAGPSTPYMVPFIPVKAQAGYVRAVDQEMFLNTLEQYALPPGIAPHGSNWAYWEIEGDSMEPVFKSGDLILASQVHPMDWPNLRNFYTYVIVTDERVLIKRIFCKNPLEWVLISENEEQYPQQLLSIDYIKQVWVYRKTIKTDAAPTKQFDIKV